MSQTVDIERRQMVVETRLERSKRIRQQLNDVVRLWLEGLTVTLMAERLGTSKHRVYFLLRVLELNESPRGRLKYMRPGHLYGLKVPAIGDLA